MIKEVIENPSRCMEMNFIKLQQEVLMKERDTMLLKEEKVSDTHKRKRDTDRESADPLKESATEFVASETYQD